MNMSQNVLFSKKDLSHLIWPLIAEQLLMVAIGACDTFMVSSTGDAGISGVSLVDYLSHFFMALFSAFATGGAVVVSQYIGNKDVQKGTETSHQLITVAFLMGVFFVLICLPFKSIILNLVYRNIETDVMENALSYFFWIVLSMPFLAAYLGCTAVARSTGNSRLTLKVGFIGNLINTAGNGLLIYVFDLGVTGAGIATLVSRVAIVFIILHMLKNKDNQIQIRFVNLIWQKFDQVGKILKVAVPSGIENSFFQVGRIFVTSITAGLGTIASSANAITGTFESVSNIPGNAIGLAALTVIGQCIGADEKEQARNYGRKLMIQTYLGMGAISVIVFFTVQWLIIPFELSPEALDLATGVVRTIMIANILVWPLSFVMPNILRGAGDAKYTMIVSNISMWAFRVALGLLISDWMIARFPENPSYALYGIRIAMYADWTFRAVLFYIRFRGSRWLEKKVI